jgi:hypothetical protein
VGRGRAGTKCQHFDLPVRYPQLEMADIQKRGSYTPRRVREQRAYRLAVGGTVAGAIGVVGLVLAFVGVIGAGLPIIALIVAALCAFGFMRMTGTR